MVNAASGQDVPGTVLARRPGCWHHHAIRHSSADPSGGSVGRIRWRISKGHLEHGTYLNAPVVF